MKNHFISLVLLTSLSLNAQAHIGVMGGFDLENEYSKLGAGLSLCHYPKLWLAEGL